MFARSGQKLAMGLILGWLVMTTASGQEAVGQVPVATPDVKQYSKKLEFFLPVRIADEHRVNLREMHLYVKGPTGEWTKQDTVPANATRFTCRVPSDGEYWYSVVTVNMNNKVHPEDVMHAPPSLKVVVDTQPPLLDVRTWTGPDGDIFVKCTMIDANPDPASIRLICRTAAGVENAVEPIAGQTGLFRVFGDAAPVRVTGKDLAKNETSQEVNYKPIASVATAPSIPTTGSNGFPPTPQQYEPQGTVVPAPNVNNLNGGSSAIPITSSFPPQPALPPAKNDVVQLPRDPLMNLPSAPPSMPPTVTPPVNTPGGNPISIVQTDTLPKIPAAPATPTTATGNRKLLGSTKATIEYRIDQVGPSGVGKVEIFITGDQGQTWQRLKEDFNKRSPVDVELPGEGVFGVAVVVTNGNGYGGTPPQRGDQPAYWIEVDTTCPFVQLRPVDSNIASSGTIDIRWSASDKNLAAEPVSLFYRTRPEGAWQKIATGLKNDGVHHWAIPRGAGPQFYFKIEVVDQVGNIGRQESQNAVVLDMAEPRGVITNVIGGGQRVPGALEH